jgi:ornithine cyclodeaminase/alanine dehydrogenase-like protein (mu-crystallin family)
MLYFTESDVRRLLPMAEAVRLMREAFLKLAGGTAQNQPRRRLIMPTGSVLHYMPAGDDRYFGIKVYSTNRKHGPHFFFLLFRAEDGQSLAIFEANYLGQIRTGAVSGLATDLLARPDAATLAIIGSGFQARSQLEAMRAVREIRAVRVWSRSDEKRVAFAAECSVEAADSAEAAVRGADIVVTATNAKDPVLEADWVSPGAHVNLMGSNQAARREAPPELLERAALIAVDSVEQAKMESGDLLLAWKSEQWNDPRLVELKDVLTGKSRGRENPGDITLFKSNGLALEDVAAAGYVYERALEAGLGRSMAPLYS